MGVGCNPVFHVYCLRVQSWSFVGTAELPFSCHFLTAIALPFAKKSRVLLCTSPVNTFFLCVRLSQTMANELVVEYSELCCKSCDMLLLPRPRGFVCAHLRGVSLLHLCLAFCHEQRERRAGELVDRHSAIPECRKTSFSTRRGTEAALEGHVPPPGLRLMMPMRTFLVANFVSGSIQMSKVQKQMILELYKGQLRLSYLASVRFS
jgi:hypothetical protein